jgi:undecaprenyl diphosphate synthase
VLNLCIGYGGRQEILDAVMSSMKWLRKNPRVAKLHEKVFERHLMIPRPLDVVIRTGGEKRLSGFMLYQIEYAELFFIDTLWPEFSLGELDSILREFSARDRRFGK